ncbi:hypothetical protein Trydic_g8869 [Trypoxylus dichotomus]
MKATMVPIGMTGIEYTTRKTTTGNQIYYPDPDSVISEYPDFDILPPLSDNSNPDSLSRNADPYLSPEVFDLDPLRKISEHNSHDPSCSDTVRH